jgi:hypothetical protein
LGSPVLDLQQGHAHGRVFFAAQGHLYAVVHEHNFRGQHSFGSRMGKTRQSCRLTHQQQAGLRVTLQKSATSTQRDLRAVIAPHAIHRQGNARPDLAQGRVLGK